ncbi:hypothetical protein [Burkholderia sp. USMB20]|uniref:hypothetical protein n=1 Tax=Burkholderia sp. USMB20 TaxID=1571773 RepID=UPI00187D12B3|nr:hypothetical protein [Burkholderia sp. USMB20]
MSGVFFANIVTPSTRPTTIGGGAGRDAGASGAAASATGSSLRVFASDRGSKIELVIQTPQHA